jgi:chitosanase
MEPMDRTSNLLLMEQKILNKIIQVVRYFETGKVVGADYGALSIYNDGPGNRRQVTYGASQTTEFGNLKDLIQMYVDAKGIKASDFKPYLTKIGNEKPPSLAADGFFISLLKSAALDPIMHTVQDAFFLKHYFNPAQSWFTKNGFTLPLSLLVVYDSYVHSGSIPDFLRNKFAEKVPVNGGNEKEWIQEYVDARDTWLENNTSRPILQQTDYRTDSFIHAIRQENWLLDKPFEVVNYKEKDESDNPRVEAKII